MWQCSSCEYVNDDWDERCLRCGVDRVTSEAEHALRAQREAEERASQPPEPPVELSALERSILAGKKAGSEAETGSGTEAEAEAGAESGSGASEGQGAGKSAELDNTAVMSALTPGTSSGISGSMPRMQGMQDEVDKLLVREVASGNAEVPEEKRGKRSELASVIIIAICLIGLVAVGYVAWSRGLISLPQTVPQNALDYQALGYESQPAYPKNDALSSLLADRSRTARAFQGHAQLLYDCQAAYARILDDMTPMPSQDGIREQLDRAEAVSKRWLEDYAGFEDATVPKMRKLDVDTIGMLREQYAARASELMGIMQLGYLGLNDPQHTAFLFVDSIPQEFGRFGQIDASSFSEQWQQVREQRRQTELDVQYALEIEETEAWYSTLATLHAEVDKVIRSLGEVGSNRGRLNPAAVKLVVLLDDYATKIEGLNSEFEQYASSLPETECDSLNEAVEKFRALALEDHMYCFGEIYKRYSEDRYAELEQYDRLGAHYEYAEQWWPRKKADYEGIFTTYEKRWRESWTE